MVGPGRAVAMSQETLETSDGGSETLDEHIFNRRETLYYSWGGGYFIVLGFQDRVPLCGPG